jgi:hypothetical protein
VNNSQKFRKALKLYGFSLIMLTGSLLLSTQLPAHASKGCHGGQSCPNKKVPIPALGLGLAGLGMGLARKRQKLATQRDQT